MNRRQLPGLARNLAVYAVGVGLAVAGALGMAGAIALHPALSVGLLTLGLIAVLTVHEFLGGPIPSERPSAEGGTDSEGSAAGAGE